jgi:hypothetical protein
VVEDLMSIPGLLTAMVTPYQEDLSVDYLRAAQLAEYLCDHGSEALVVCGTTGESPVLKPEEKLKLFSVVKERVGGRVPVWAGTGSNDTRATVELENEKYIKGQSKKRSRTSPSVPRKFISSDDLEILVGRNNRQNDLLSMKMAERSDLWLHTKNSPGTHVIIKLPRQIKSIHDMPDRSLEEAALLAAHFSKAAESEKVEVDYTFRSNVKKPGGARPGMVIYDQYWTLVVNPQEDRLQEILSREVKNE